MQNTFRDNVLLFLPLNKIWVVMLPSVTSFTDLLKTMRYPLSSYGADHTPCPAGAFSRAPWGCFSGAPDSVCFSVHPHPCLCKTRSSLLSRLQFPMPASPWLSPLGWHKAPQTQHVSPELTAFLPHMPLPPSSVLSISGVSIIIYQVAQGTDSVSLHIHPGSTHPLLVWPPKVLFHLLSFLHPVATVPGQLTKVLPLMPPTLS